MGQSQAKDSRIIIPELKDVTLRGVVPLNKELGRGAYGRVFTVKHNGKICAAKELHSILIENCGSSEEEQKIKDNFIRECLCCSSIQHPNIVQFLGVYYPSNQSVLPVMVMELMNNSLTFFVESHRQNIAFSTKVSILHDVSLALSFLHNCKPSIVHHDLSPNNIMLTNQLVAKIGDLGVAKILKTDSKNTRTRTQAAGTSHFMPPEALDEVYPAYGTPIDVFSFGGIALYVCSEEWPIPTGFKKRDPVTKKMLAVNEVERRQQYLDKMTGKCAQLRGLVERCLDDDPDERPPIREISTIIGPLQVSITVSTYIYVTFIILLSLNIPIMHYYQSRYV